MVWNTLRMAAERLARARQAGHNGPVDDDAELPALIRAALERGAVSG